jgi:hypothetical protein
MRDELLLPGALDIDLAPILAHYEEHGYARVGPALAPAGIAALRARTDAIMLGEVVYPDLFFQLDTVTGRYEDLQYKKGWEGPSLNYRKVEKLERDPLFFTWIDNPLFERIARARIAGDVAIYRACLFNKAKQGGTVLPFHQDGGVYWGLDRDPDLQIWTALDDAPIEAGCVEVVPGSHKGGLATPLGGRIPDDLVRERGMGDKTIPLPVKAGEVLLLHNYLWHRSGVNRTDAPRRGLTVCYMSAATRCLRRKRAPRVFTRVFERGAISPRESVVDGPVMRVAEGRVEGRQA